jgi:hypothetical protein
MTDIGWLVALAAIAVVLVAAVWLVARLRRRQALRRRFGEEYDHAVAVAPKRSLAERDLLARQKRVAKLELHALSPARRGELRESWRQVEVDFVDHPAAAVAAAEELLRAAMAERGYPVGSPDYRIDDLAVEHAEAMRDYRQAAEIAARGARGGASTEDLRQAMKHYRRLFESLVEAAEPAAREKAS